MKKVLILAAVTLLLAAPAMANIATSKHNLSTTGTGSVTSNTNETCVFCHTPHGAAAVGFAPLWNRGTVSATGYYANPAGTMNAVTSLAGVNASDAVLCLSCHDGTSSLAGLNNPPNSLLGATLTITGSLSTDATLGTDLSNDHPVGFKYADSITNGDTELVTAPVGITFYGAANDTMWCSSCHDVHDDSNAPFLVKSNSASALCTTCHIK